MSAPSYAPGSATLIDIRSFSDERGALAVVEGESDIPFMPRRLYYLYGSDPSRTRAHHAHRAERQCMIALAGSAEVEIDTGRERRTFLLDRPDRGLLLEPVVWRVVRMGDAASVLAVLTAHDYDPDDYIHDYDEFRALVGTP